MSINGTYPSIYVLFGCAGSGKGTFAQAIKSEGYDHISTGDMTREEVANETEFGLKYKEAIINHIFGGIPFDEIQKLLEKKLTKALLENKGVILDGYPKTIDQCEFLDNFIKEKELKNRVVFILLDVKEEDVIDRILYRQTCEKCGKIYNSKFSPSKKEEECDECQGTLSKRMDNNSIEGAKKRVFGFKDKMGSVINYYRKSDRLDLVDGNGTPEECKKKFINFHKSKFIKE
jgi:adenylate kinase